MLPTPASLTIAAFAAVTPPSSPVQDLPDAALDVLEWRELGPTVFGGRITDLAIRPGERSFLLVASASGGLWRSRNHGTTWECIFEDEGTISIGDIALDPSDEDVIWVGTGEANNQRSSYWGDGVYKSSDGGKTWKNTGLAESHHIGRVVVDPTRSEVVYVAALGHLYTPNEERGLYKTSDGGATWRRVLYVSPDVGAVDVCLDPADSRTVYAATYERRRRAWHFDGAGPGSGIWKSTDAGATWKRLTGGLPDGEIGRIGLTVHPSGVLYATVSNQNEVEVVPEGDPTVGLRTRFRKGELTVSEVAADSGAERAGLRRGDVLVQLGEVRFDGPFGWVGALSRYDANEELDLVYRRDEEEVTTRVRIADLVGSIEERRRTRQVGGEVYKSDDRGATWVKRNERSVGGSPPYYYGQIRVDPGDVDRLYLPGVPLYASSDGGASWERIAGSVHVDHHALEVDPEDSRRVLLGNDGGLAISHDRGATWDHYDNLPLAQFYAVGVDHSQPFRVYGGTQDNGTWGGPSRSRTSRGIGAEDWFRVGGGDGFFAQIDWDDARTVYAESQFGALYRRDVESWATTRIRPPGAADGEEPHRYNWSSPILVSHHNPRIVYFGGNRLFKSYDRGDTWALVTDDLTTADPDKIAGNVPHCTLTTIAESALDPSVLMVGSDDGLVHLSEDGGLTWTNLTGRFPGAPANWWVSRVVLSRHERDTAYVAFTGYREDDFRPFLYATTNRGRNWRRLEDLPQEPVNVVHEDPRNPDVLYVGTELGAYASLDRGASWRALGAGLPTIAVHDLVVHPRDHELVLATHGRGFWALDVSVLGELTGDAVTADAHLFGVRDAVTWQTRNRGGGSGDRAFQGTNPPDGIAIAYRLGRDWAKEELELTVVDAAGDVVARPEVASKAGLHVARWNLRRSARGRDDDDGDEEQVPARFRRGGGRVPHGQYAVVLKAGEQVQRRPFAVKPDPILDE